MLIIYILNANILNRADKLSYQILYIYPKYVDADNSKSTTSNFKFTSNISMLMHKSYITSGYDIKSLYMLLKNICVHDTAFLNQKIRSTW